MAKTTQPTPGQLERPYVETIVTLSVKHLTKSDREIIQSLNLEEGNHGVMVYQWGWILDSGPGRMVTDTIGLTNWKKLSQNLKWLIIKYKNMGIRFVRLDADAPADPEFTLPEEGES